MCKSETYGSTRALLLIPILSLAAPLLFLYFSFPFAGRYVLGAGCFYLSFRDAGGEGERGAPL